MKIRKLQMRRLGYVKRTSTHTRRGITHVWMRRRLLKEKQ